MDDETKEYLEYIKRVLIIEYVIITLCSIFFVIYAAVATFVFKKVGFSKCIMTMLILTIGIVIATLILLFSVNAILY